LLAEIFFGSFPLVTFDGVLNVVPDAISMAVKKEKVVLIKSF